MLDLTTAFATFPALETDRCLLREITPDDAPAIFRLMGDARVTRYLGRHPLATLEDAAQRIEVYQSLYRDETGIYWGITDRANGDLVGMCLYMNISKPHHRGEIGYSLMPEWWGQRVMSEVVSAVLNCGFSTIGFHTVEARIDPENTGSRRLLEKMGFVQEGYLHESYYDSAKEQFTDSAIFSLLKSTWMKKTPR